MQTLVLRYQIARVQKSSDTAPAISANKNKAINFSTRIFHQAFVAGSSEANRDGGEPTDFIERRCDQARHGQGVLVLQAWIGYIDLLGTGFHTYQMTCATRGGARFAIERRVLCGDGAGVNVLA